MPYLAAICTQLHTLIERILCWHINQLQYREWLFMRPYQARTSSRI